MARTIPQIQAAIAADRADRAELAALTSPSATALYVLVEYVVAVAQWAHETLWDRFQADVNAVVARAPVGTPGWYADRALQFQQGGTLQVLDNVIGYPVGSTGARVITRAAAKENKQTGKLLVKVAANGPTPGTLAALDAPTLTQVRGYFDRLQFAGTKLEVVSRDADRLQLTGQVYYDPLLNVPALQAAVRAGLAGYLATLDFAGQVYVAKLEDAIQAVPGVRDVLLTLAAARVGQVAPVPFARLYETAAGYIVEEDTVGLSFLDTLQFVPDVR
ncbi:hypothetical protein [Hymenobacter nivis]|nr:hypothetical protein [Hymenobacter nivis]